MPAIQRLSQANLPVSFFLPMFFCISLGLASTALAQSNAESSHRNMDRQNNNGVTDIEQDEAEYRRQFQQQRAANRRAVAAATQRAEGEPESWYFMWGMGAALAEYPAADKAMIDSYSNSGSRQGVNMDMLGFYWPVTNWMISGFIINAVGDSFRLDNGDTFLSSRGILGASNLIFVSGEVGRGLFIRGDAGFGSFAERLNGVDQKTGQGLGALGGIGWGFPVSDESRVLIGLNYSAIYARSALYTAPSLSVYGLW